MKKFIICSALIASVGGLSAADISATAHSAAIRVDTRMGLFGGKLATGAEAIGEPDGSDTSSWVTTNSVAGVQEFTDGWYERKVDEYGFKDWFPLGEGDVPDHDLLLLNEPVVSGGRLATNEVWSSDNLHVVRHNVVIPAGKTLTIETEAPVKFTEEARIVVEEGGALIAKGAWLAEIQDDEWVAGDTNLDGDNSAPTGTQDWIAGVDPEDYVHVLMLDGNEQVFPTRTYTRGQVYGALPVRDRYDEGFFFRGWVTNLSDRVGVAVDQLAEMDQGALYCNWETIYLTPATSLVEFAAFSVDEVRSFAVESNDKWIYSCDADWLDITLEPNAEGFGGMLNITAAENRSEMPRSATIVISRENGKLAREVSVVQAAMEHVAAPLITSATGETLFSDYMVQVAISTETPGSEIYYTTDGTEPTAENAIKLTTYDYMGRVIGVINVYNSLTIKAVAVNRAMLDSEVTSVRFTRESTLAEAMDIPDYYVTTDGDAEWSVVKDVTYDGNSAVRSGSMTTSKTKRRYSRLYTYVEGQGTLTFKWKVSCEKDWTGNCDWDYLAFIADGTVVKKIEGKTDWAEVSYKFTGNGAHVIQWVYTKNGGFEDYNPGDDCGWVDQVSWTPALFVTDGGDIRELYTDPSWMMRVGIVGCSQSDEEIIEAAQADNDGDGYTNEEEALLGTDPNDPDSKLRISIAADEDGIMRVDYSPEQKNSNDKNYTLSYRIMGITDLGGNWKDVTDMSEVERQEKGFRFFKVKVDVNRK